MHKKFTLACLLAVLLFGRELLAQRLTSEDFRRIDKIDVHAHIHTDNLDFVALSQRDNFRFVNMAVWSNPDPDANREKHRTTFAQFAAYPDQTVPVVSFPLENWDDDDWTQQTIDYLRDAFDKGAVGVKVWKNIGMELRDRDGKLVMIDHPKFDAVFEYINTRGKVLIGHLGEPKNCWLPLEEMTTLNDRSYFSRNPKYHMALHPEMPTYQDQIDARDRMLAKNTSLTFVACHLASLEWNVDAIAQFLDRFPNAVVEVAARLGQVQYQSNQDRQRVIDFFVKYQDRIMYGTDLGVEEKQNAESAYQQARMKWLRDWAYFATEDEFLVPELENPVKGLGLPREVLEKIYARNAVRTYPNAWPTLQEKYSTQNRNDQ